jgi:hypothetical protein
MSKTWNGDAWVVQVAKDGKIEIGFSNERLAPYQALQLADALTQASQYALRNKHTAT